MKVPILSVLLMYKEFLYINLILLVKFLNKVRTLRTFKSTDRIGIRSTAKKRTFSI